MREELIKNIKDAAQEISTLGMEEHLQELNAEELDSFELEELEALNEFLQKTLAEVSMFCEKNSKLLEDFCLEQEEFSYEVAEDILDFEDRQEITSLREKINN